MALLPLVPETSASTDSATSAGLDRAKDPNDPLKSYYPKDIHGPRHGKEIKEKKFTRMHELMTVS